MSSHNFQIFFLAVKSSRVLSIESKINDSEKYENTKKLLLLWTTLSHYTCINQLVSTWLFIFVWKGFVWGFTSPFYYFLLSFYDAHWLHDFHNTSCITLHIFNNNCINLCFFRLPTVYYIFNSYYYFLNDYLSELRK